METQHTPGTWRVDGNGGTGIEIWAEARFGPQCIAVMDGGPRMESDARLIAAAPDLLAALRALLATSDLNFDSLEPDTVRAIQTARAVMAKVSA